MTEAISSIEGESKRSVAGKFVLNVSPNPRVTSVAPMESTPASISGDFVDMCVPVTFSTHERTACRISIQSEAGLTINWLEALAFA